MESVQAPVPPQIAALTAADCESLRTSACSGMLEWVLVAIMAHQRSKLLSSTGWLDTVSPFSHRYEVCLLNALLVGIQLQFPFARIRA